MSNLNEVIVKAIDDAALEAVDDALYEELNEEDKGLSFGDLFESTPDVSPVPTPEFSPMSTPELSPMQDPLTSPNLNRTDENENENNWADLDRFRLDAATPSPRLPSTPADASPRMLSSGTKRKASQALTAETVLQALNAKQPRRTTWACAYDVDNDTVVVIEWVL